MAESTEKQKDIEQISEEKIEKNEGKVEEKPVIIVETADESAKPIIKNEEIKPLEAKETKSSDTDENETAETIETEEKIEAAATDEAVEIEETDEIVEEKRDSAEWSTMHLSNIKYEEKSFAKRKEARLIIKAETISDKKGFSDVTKSCVKKLNKAFAVTLDWIVDKAYPVIKKYSLKIVEFIMKIIVPFIKKAGMTIAGMIKKLISKIKK